MKTQNLSNSISKRQNGFFSRKKNGIYQIILLSIMLFYSQALFAHCDSYDGPVIKDAFEALESNKVNLILKWVNEDQEEKITALFKKTYSLKKGDREIYKIVEMHFLETLVRLHRETEGEPYTGLKPAGSTSKIIQMADNSIEIASVEELTTNLTAHIENVVREKFEKVIELAKVKEESLEYGRAYVGAYVDYTHSLEAIHSILEHGITQHMDHME